ncbi:unnamed protein product [Cladocopium goreaui]|uniref:Tc1-like transposase DDE domain-containing protein n=1 Tax=Cladocopium goreaui TaxID=2562237 RepID=A0A9P1D6J8_9DINO|nr:unnamed protein product [Cladocopium goreaui]
MVSHLQLCQRALVSALLAVAAVLNVEPSVSRDSDPPCLRAAYGTVLRKARGRTDGEALTRLRAAKVSWEQALNHKGPQGRPASNEAVYRIECSAVLLTYQSFTSLDQWRRFANCVKANAPLGTGLVEAVADTSPSGAVEHVAHRCSLGLDFQNQRKVVILRDVQGLSFVDIAAQVKNLAGKQPSPRTCCQYYKQFSVSRGRKKTAYNNCGRRPWKLTTATQGFVLRSLRRMRKQGMCTTKSLQAELARARGVAVDQSTIRKFLQAQGYRWLPRGQKRKYTPQQMSERKAFAEAVVALGPCRLRQKLSFSMDGCVLTMPPKNLTERLNYLHSGQTHMWRLKSERLEPSLAGQDCFAKQSPLDRCIPLWGGLSEGGFATVVFHAKKKLTKAEWIRVLQAGKVASAIKSLRPVKKDALKKRPWIGKWAYKTRIKNLLKSAHAQNAAKRIAKGYIKTCREVVRKGGAASSG